MNELKAELDRFMEGTRSNPPTERLYDFLGDLSSEGKLFDYSEQDWVEAGRSYGMSDNEISAWIETAASWLDDTTEGGEYEPAHSFWSSGGTRTMANPAPATRGISSRSARRGSVEFDDMMDELEADWEMDEEELGEIVEIRRSGESFEIRLKGGDRWELIEDDEEEDSDDGDGPVGPDEDFGEGEEE
jgi:hypothetical protein